MYKNWLQNEFIMCGDFNDLVEHQSIDLNRYSNTCLVQTAWFCPLWTTIFELTFCTIVISLYTLMAWGKGVDIKYIHFT